MRASHLPRQGRPGRTRNESTISVPVPATFEPTARPPFRLLISWLTSFRFSSLASIAGGMIRGRLPGSAKKANTFSTGCASHCSDSKRDFTTIMHFTQKRSNMSLTGQQLVLDEDVQAVLEFMQAKVATCKLVQVAEALPRMA